MLAWHMLRRELRSGGLTVLLLSLGLAVAIVTGIAGFTHQVQQALAGEAARFLAADRVITSSRALPAEWADEADRRGLRTASFATFPTMVFAGDVSALAVVKAVSEHYPLRGALEISALPYAAAETVARGPASGRVWLDARLWPALAVAPGAVITVGELDLVLEAVLVTEPDNGNQLSMMAPRLMMAAEDLAATGIVQPGSRVEYSLLLAGPVEALDAFADWLQPQLQDWHRWQTLEDGRPGVARALERAGAFLLLSAALAVLLAAIAAWLAARHYAHSQRRAVAVLKTLGADRWRLQQVYGGLLAGLGVLAILAGLVSGWLLEQLLRALISPLLNIQWPAPALYGYAAGAGVGLLCLLLFVWPRLASLHRVAPDSLLREAGEQVQREWTLLPGLLVLCLAVSLLSGWWQLGVFFLAAVLACGLLLALVVRSLLALARRFRPQPGSALYLALLAWQRRPWGSAIQIMVFSLAFLLTGTVSLVRSSLLDDWQRQLPTRAPNHFLLNIAADEQVQVAHFLAENGVESAGLFPMIRGRLLQVNGAEPVVRQPRPDQERDESLNRELNLSWSASLPADNRIEAGQWWPTDGGAGSWVSVEAGLAERLGLQPGDRVTFNIGGSELEAEIRSIRSLDWESMRPNFYFLFAPGVIEQYPATWMTSFYLPPDRHEVPLALSRAFPTVSVIALEGIFAQIRAVIAQVSLAMQLVFGLMLAACVLVLLAALQASLGERRWESALLKSLGAEPSVLRLGLWLEFALMGLLAGLLGALGADAALWLVASRVLAIEPVLHPWLWLALPLIGLLLVSVAGYGRLHRVLAVPPARILQAGQGTD